MPALSDLKSGTLRFWGLWFGKPHDNWHRIVSGGATSGALQFRFDNAELLSVWNPRGLKANASIFRIEDASRIRWEWFYYGRPHTPENLYFLDFFKGDVGTTNVDWYKPELVPLKGYPAVEIV
jgi:hypothetical protein